MKLTITPELRARLLHAETLEVEVPDEERRITKPARVWGARFMPGVAEQTVIDAAYRYAEHEASQEEKQAGKINFDLLMAAVHKTVPEGWQLVPVAPDYSMLTADGCKEHAEGQKCVHHDNRRRIWAAMLAAAPKPEGEGAV